MEYTDIEKQILSNMERTDFKNISKSEVISFASKLGELRPEVAKEVIANFPEVVGLIKSVMIEYKGLLDSIVESDDASLKQYFDIANKEIDNANESRKQFFSLVEQMQSDYSKLLDNPNLPPEILLEILKRQSELVKIASDKDSEIRAQEKEIEDKVNKKDTEKREHNWKLVSNIGLVLVTVVGISAGVLGGKFDFKLPQKN